MTEQEGIEVLTTLKGTGAVTGEEIDAIDAVDEAMFVLEQYRAIGNVEGIKANMEELKRWHTDKTNPKIKNVFANTSTLICHNCDHKDDYIEDLQDYIEKLEAGIEIDEYRTIGTVEECRAAVEKQKAKKPDFEGDGYADGYLVYDTWICPCCGKHYEVDYDDYDFCPNCGQKLDWSEEE